MIRHLLRNNLSPFSTLILGQHNGQNLSKNTMKLLSAGKKFNEDIHIMLVGKQLNKVVEHINSNVGGVKKVLTIDDDRIIADKVQSCVNKAIEKNGYKRVIGLTSSYGKDVIPRIAGKCQVQPITDIIQIIDQKNFMRPMYAGNAVSKVQSQEPIDFLTFRPSSFQQSEAGTSNVEVQAIQSDQAPLAKFVSQQKSDSSKPDLTTARIVVSGGRGVKSKQNFDIIYKFADAFGDAAVGASRAAVDAGYCPNQMQVGQTGKVVAPNLYIAVGISGAVQHLAGMKDSKYIVAINNRPDEPIFEIADYGLEADLFKVLPQLTEKIQKIKAG